MSAELTPEQRQFTELMFGLPTLYQMRNHLAEANGLLQSCDYPMPFSEDNVSDFAWNVADAYDIEAPLYKIVTSLDLRERYAIRFADRLGKLSLLSRDLVTASNCSLFMSKTSYVVGKYRSICLNQLIKVSGNDFLDMELERIFNDED